MFNSDKFLSSNFELRTKDVEIKELKAFFEEKEKPLFTLRGLGGEDCAKCREAKQAASNMGNVIDAIVSARAPQKAEAIKNMLGIGNSTLPDDYVYRIEVLVAGCIKPEMSSELAVKIATYFPTVFYQLTNTILELTGLGASLGELKPSGVKKK